MNRMLSVLLATGLMALAACAPPGGEGERAPARPPAQKADAELAEVIYSNGSIWSGVSGAARASALAVAQGRLLAIGDEATVDRHAGPATMRIDLAGRFVVPGFIDNHTHFLYGGAGLASVNLRDAATPEEFARRIGAFAAKLAPGQWVANGDWDHENWGGDLPRAEWIDDVTPDTPVFVMRLDGHMGLANAKAMEIAGVGAHTVTPEGGEIPRLADDRPAGVFKDTAMALILSAMPPATQDELDTALDAAQTHALARGVTQIHDVGFEDEPRFSSLETFRRAHARDALKLRVYSFFPLRDWPQIADFVKAHGRGDDRLRWGGVKGFVDGSLGSTTAWFYAPYTDAPETSGFALGDLSALEGWIDGANGAGLHVTVHAIGDRANDWVLERFARIGGVDSAARRFRIEHAQHLTQEAIARFGKLGVIASMQPYHAIDDGRWAGKRIGPERIRGTYAFASLLDAGAIVTFGSDWTVAPIDPLLGIYAAVTRRTLDDANPDGWVPEQKITVAQALRAYTGANAYAGFQEDKLGTLEAGKLADFVVLSEDLFAIPPERIRQVKVLRTVIGGETVFGSAY